MTAILDRADHDSDPVSVDLSTVPVAPSVDALPLDALPLDAAKVSVHFGGLAALDHVSIQVRPNEIVGLIGGNGAGKTTFMNCVSGYVDAAPGAHIRAFGNDLMGLAPEHRPYVDVGRSYQAATLFAGLSVTETLLVAVERHNPTGLLGAIIGTGRARRVEAAKRQQVDELITATGLDVYRERLIGELSTGTRRVVDIACILAQRPGLLLLDEPTGGLAQRETEAFAPLIKGVQRQLGCAVLVIEHDMVMIGQLCDRVYAMETGRVIAEGTADEVRNDPRVIASYLGTDEIAIARSGTAAPAPKASRESAHPPAPDRTPASTSAPPHTRTVARPVRPPRRRRALVAAPDFESMTRSRLLDLARDAAIPGRSAMRKTDLAVALAEHHRSRNVAPR